MNGHPVCNKLMYPFCSLFPGGSSEAFPDCLHEGGGVVAGVEEGQGDQQHVERVPHFGPERERSIFCHT